MKIVRKLLTPDEISNPAIRWNEECDCAQQTPDGGVTWVDAPGLDPRSAPGFAMPPVSSDDPHCDGAARMIAAVHQLIDIIISAGSFAEAASLFLSVLERFLYGIGQLIALILDVVAGLIALGGEVLDAAFTGDVYDQLLCLAYNHLGSDGHFDGDGWTAFQSDVAAVFSGTVEIAMGLIFQVEGINGFNNAASVGTETGDCSDCVSCPAPGCYEWNFSATTLELGWEVGPGYWTPGYEGGIFQQQCVGGIGSDSTLTLEQDFPQTPVSLHCDVHSIEFDAQVVGDSTDWLFEYMDSGGTFHSLLSGSASPGATATIGGTCTPVDAYGLRLTCTTTAGCGTGDVYIHAIRIASDDLCGINLQPNC